MNQSQIAAIDFMEYSIDEIGIILKQQEQEWNKQVTEIMTTLNITTYPTKKQFKEVGQSTLYNQIDQYMSCALHAESMGLMEPKEQQLRDIVFDLMLKFEIIYYPNENIFKMGRKYSTYKRIAAKYGHEEFRKRMKLLSVDEWKELKKGR